MPQKQTLIGGLPAHIHNRWHEQIQHDCCDEWKDYHSFMEWFREHFVPGKIMFRIEKHRPFQPDNVIFTEIGDYMRQFGHVERGGGLTVNGETHSAATWGEIITGNRRTVERWITKHGKDYAKHRIKQFLEHE